MSTLRKKLVDNYTQVPNETLEDPRLSLRAVGLLMHLIAKPDGWRVDATQISKVVKEGRDAVQAALRELGEAGYYRLTRERLSDGRFRMVTDIAAWAQPEWAVEWVENKASGKIKTVDAEPEPAFQAPENQAPGNPALETRPQVPKNLSNEPEQETPDGVSAKPDLKIVLSVDDPLPPWTKPSLPTPNQRSNYLARWYCDRQPLAEFHAIRKIVAKAVEHPEGITDEAIRAALAEHIATAKVMTAGTLYWSLHPDSQPGGRNHRVDRRRRLVADEVAWAQAAMAERARQERLALP